MWERLQLQSEPIWSKVGMEQLLESTLPMTMEFLGYESCMADPDLWLVPEIRPKDGVKYYSYLLCYVDDILCIHHNANAMLEWLHKFFFALAKIW